VMIAFPIAFTGFIPIYFMLSPCILSCCYSLLPATPPLLVSRSLPPIFICAHNSKISTTRCGPHPPLPPLPPQNSFPVSKEKLQRHPASLSRRASTPPAATCDGLQFVHRSPPDRSVLFFCETERRSRRLQAEASVAWRFLTREDAAFGTCWK
jgi:hypothetical protein